jgi:hypothetical protein
LTSPRDRASPPAASNYSVQADREHRALAGLSIGGSQLIGDDLDDARVRGAP